ncbi:hypothetical protein MMC19_001159 [Ptychographa xylographoides]|nr:hypothetical protein [Ptychographa xylographoides]
MDCPNPRAFRGTCRVCQKEGHPASECPEKPADICRNCKKEGHKIADCKENRAIDTSGVSQLEPDTAWAKMKTADEEHELEDLREALKEYVKAVPDTTYEQLEVAFRGLGFKTHVIGFEKEITDTYTLMNLQGKLDCKYHVGFYWNAKAPRLALKDAWPTNPEENLERLKDAGVPVERGIPKCSNCDGKDINNMLRFMGFPNTAVELGHISKSCTQDKAEKEAHNLDIVLVIVRRHVKIALPAGTAGDRDTKRKSAVSHVRQRTLNARFVARWVTLQKNVQQSRLKPAETAVRRAICRRSARTLATQQFKNAGTATKSDMSARTALFPGIIVGSSARTVNREPSIEGDGTGVETGYPPSRGFAAPIAEQEAAREESAVVDNDGEVW